LNNSVDLIYHDLKIIRFKNGKIESRTKRTRQVKNPVNMDFLINGNAIPNSSSIVRKKILNKIGGISENKKMIASEDFNTWVRISNITEKFLYIPKTLGFYLAHENNISNKEDMSLNMECAYSEFMHLLSPSQQNKINSNFCYMRGRQAYVKNQHANAIKDLYFVVCHGTTLYMIKSIYMIMIIILKKYLSKKL
jgi:hypothetical protein